MPPGVTPRYIDSKALDYTLDREIWELANKAKITDDAKAPPVVPAKAPPPSGGITSALSSSIKAHPPTISTTGMPSSWRAPATKARPKAAQQLPRVPEDRDEASGEDDDGASVTSTMSTAAKRRAK